MVRIDTTCRQVVLHHVAHRAELPVELAAPLDAERLRHRDLHALDVRAVPHRLEEGVGETEVQVRFCTASLPKVVGR